MRVRKPFMSAPAYEVVAGVVREIVDPELRQRVADHFATAFHKRSPTFNPYTWERSTGGKVQRAPQTQAPQG